MAVSVEEKKPLVGGSLDDGISRRSTVGESRWSQMSGGEKVLPDTPGTMGRMACIMNLTTCCVGSGLLAFPAAGYKVGWIGCIFSIGLAGLISSVCVALLGDVVTAIKQVDRHADVSSFEKTVLFILGKKGYNVVVVIFNFALICLAIVFLCLIGGQMGQSIASFMYPYGPYTEFSGVSNEMNFAKHAVGNKVIYTSLHWEELLGNWKLYSMLIALVFLMPLCYLKDMAMIGKFSIVGVLASVVTVGCIIVFSALNYMKDIPENDEFQYGVSNYFGASEEGVLAYIPAFVNFVFGYGSALIVPSTMGAMKNPGHFTQVCHSAHALTSAIYAITTIAGIIGIGSVLKAGGNVIGLMETNLHEKNCDGALDVFGQLSALTTVVSLAISFPQMNNVFFQFVETGSLFKKIEGKLPEKIQRSASLLFRTIFVLFITAICIATVEIVMPIMGIVAAACMLPLCILVPVICYWSLETQQRGFSTAVSQHKLKFVMHVLFFLVAVVCSGMGVYYNVMDAVSFFTQAKASKATFQEVVRVKLT